MKAAVLVLLLASAFWCQKPLTQTLRVTSKDGAIIGFECAGDGPTILFVHGGVGDRTRWTPLFRFLAKHNTVCAMDRRGRGLSGDHPDYSLRKEAEDIAAVVDSFPDPISVFGHSYGAVAALEASFLTNRIAKLMLYEPPLHDPVGNNLAAAAEVEALIAQGDLETAFITFQREVVQQSPAQIEKMKAHPNWKSLVTTIAVHPRQMRALAEYRFNADRLKSIRIPVLLLTGEETASPYLKQSIDVLKNTLARPRLVVLEAEGHNAMDSSRPLLADLTSKFAASER